MEGITLRRADARDAEAILKITRDSFLSYREKSGANSLAALSETADDILRDISKKLVLVAEKDGAVLGSVRVGTDGDTAYLSRFAVAEDARGMGVGTYLIDEVDKIMKKNGVRKISLHCASKLTPIIRFYYGCGFYIDAVDKSAGYLRASLSKDYDR